MLEQEGKRVRAYVTKYGPRDENLYEIAEKACINLNAGVMCSGSYFYTFFFLLLVQNNDVRESVAGRG